MGILGGLLPLLALSCGGPGGLSCTDLYAYGLNVVVKDDATNQPICDAVVTAVDSGYSEQLAQTSIGVRDCAYVGAGERAGSYTLSATKTGYLATMQGGNVVTADTCHVKGITVTLRMRH